MVDIAAAITKVASHAESLMHYDQTEVSSGPPAWRQAASVDESV